MNYFYKKTKIQMFFDYLQDKFGSNESKMLIKDQADRIEGLNSYLIRMGEYAKDIGLNVVLSHEHHSDLNFKGDVFILGDGSSIDRCNIAGAVHISPMARGNFINCLSFNRDQE